VVGKVLQYDNMPTIIANVALDEKGGITLSDFKAEK
jgi:hypothetical protein